MKVLDRSTILKHKMVDQDYDGDGKLSFSEFFDLISAFGNQLAANKVWDLVTGRLLQTRAFPLPITAIVVDPTEMKLFSSDIDY
ncbi:hypothetical protein ACSBR2_009192 [Camellia fascicularis]